MGGSSPGEGLKKAGYLKKIGFFCLLFLVLLSGCSRNYSRFMRLPADPTLESGIGWVVISSAYASLRKTPDHFSTELSVLREGTVFKPNARIIDAKGLDEGGTWYEFGEGQVSGWIHSGDTILFDSVEQARHYASGTQNR